MDQLIDIIFHVWDVLENGMVLVFFFRKWLLYT